MVLGTPIEPSLLGAALAILLLLGILYATFSGFAMVGVTPIEVLLLLFVAPWLAPINVPAWSLPGLIVGVNAAGVILPVALSARFVLADRLPVWKALLGTGLVGAVAYLVAVVEPGTGILVPTLPLVLAAGAVGLVLAGRRTEQVGPATYTAGSLGTLVGADLANLPELVDPTRADPMFAVLGGAGTLDAIFVISLWAVAGTIIAVAVGRLLTR